MSALLRLLRDEGGSAMTEYAVILSLLSCAATAALIATSQSANSSINGISSQMQSYQLNGPP
jgi:Flp pilus assembly pilin Flp